MKEVNSVTAAVLLIGDELLSGRTRDANLQAIANFLQPYGIQVTHAQIIPDIRETIIDTVNDLRVRFDYVFTTGGIGPTHDDITADCIAAAFGVGIGVRQDALDIITERYKQNNVEITPARMRMARIPDGANLIANAVSGAPGFQMENVFTLAGVPGVMRSMLEDIGSRLKVGKVIHTVTIRAEGMREGHIAETLGQLDQNMVDVGFGSYPWFTQEGYGTNLVARSADKSALQQAYTALVELVESQGYIAQINPDN